MNLAAWTGGLGSLSVLWAGAMLRACAQGGLVFLLVWLCCRLFPSISPALRAWLWRLAYLKLVLTLLVPVISVPALPAGAAPQSMDPAIGIQVPAQSPVAGPAAGQGQIQTYPLGDAVPPVRPAVLPANAAAGQPALHLHLASWLMLLWAAGAGWCLIRVAGEWTAAGWLRGISEPITCPELLRCCSLLSERLGLREPPRLLASEGAGSPVLLGGARPVVILPLALLSECTAGELELVIAHELAHRSRGDLLWGWAPAMGHALFFFYPIEWFASHEYRLAQEMACDELAIRTARTGAGDYGEALLKVAARRRPNLQSRLVTVGIVESSQILKRRLIAMKEMGSFPVRPGPAVTAAVALGLLGCMPWRLTPRAIASGTVAGEAPRELPAQERTSRPSEATPAAGETVDSTGASGAPSPLPERASAPADGPVRYHPKAGESYLYSVRVETNEADYAETLSGIVTYRCRMSDENGIILACSGGVSPTRRSIGGGGAPYRPFWPFRPFLGLHPSGFGAVGWPGAALGPNEIKIDSEGHLLSARGGSPLPRALGDLSQLIVEILPNDNSTWESRNGCLLQVQEEKPLAPFAHFAQVDQRSLPAVETISYSLGAAAGDTVEIKKSYALHTNERSFGEPTFQLSGAGAVQFDRTLGMPRSMDMKLTVTEHPDRTTTRRVPVTVTYRLLQGAERETALHPPTPPPPVHKPIADADREGILADLRSTDNFKATGAANRLADAEPTGDQKAVESALVAALNHKDGFVRISVIKALGVWGGDASVPAIIKRLDDESFAVRWAAFDVLGPKRDRRAAEPIAKWLEKDRGFATNALRKMGPAAAPAVAKQLKAGDWGLRIDVCHLLKEIGTPREIPAIQAVTADENRLVADAAAEAIKAIQARAGEKILR